MDTRSGEEGQPSSRQENGAGLVFRKSRAMAQGVQGQVPSLKETQELGEVQTLEW